MLAELVNLAQKAVYRKEDSDIGFANSESKAILYIIHVGTAWGAMAKAVIAINKHGKVRSGQFNAPEGYAYFPSFIINLGDLYTILHK
jgi:hypothetical protein